jgi:hypothetical protein
MQIGLIIHAESSIYMNYAGDFDARFFEFSEFGSKKYMSSFTSIGLTKWV